MRLKSDVIHPAICPRCNGQMMIGETHSKTCWYGIKRDGTLTKDPIAIDHTEPTIAWPICRKCGMPANFSRWERARRALRRLCGNE